jgi:hypothetical protein
VKKPGKVQAIAIYSLILGVLHAVTALMLLVYGLVAGVLTFGIGCLVWVLVPLPLATAILEIKYATMLLPDPPRPNSLAKTVAVVEIANIVYCNALTMAAGILSMVFYSDPEVQEYLLAHGITNIGVKPGAVPPPPPDPPSPPADATIITPA